MAPARSLSRPPSVDRRPVPSEMTSPSSRTPRWCSAWTPLRAPRRAAEGSAIGHDSAVARRRRNGHWRGDHARPQDLRAKRRYRYAGVFRVAERLGGKDDAKHGLFEQVASGTCAVSGCPRVSPGWTERTRHSAAVLVTQAHGGRSVARHLGPRREPLGEGVFDPRDDHHRWRAATRCTCSARRIDRAIANASRTDARPVHAAAFGPHAGVVGAPARTETRQGELAVRPDAGESIKVSCHGAHKLNGR